MRCTVVITSLLCLCVPVEYSIAGNGTIFFSEYVEGTSNNKGVEIYNNSTLPADLAVLSAQVKIYANGSATATSTISLTGTIAPGGAFVLAHSLAAFAANANQTSGSLGFNGDDAVELVINGVGVDVIGQIGFDPGTQWGAQPNSTLDHTLRRDPAICAGDANGADPFDPANEWIPFATDTFDGLGTHTANCSQPCPADINNDLMVNVTDLLAVINGWGACGNPCAADINGDNQVNVTDLLGVINAWGPCS